MGGGYPGGVLRPFGTNLPPDRLICPRTLSPPDGWGFGMGPGRRPRYAPFTPARPPPGGGGGGGGHQAAPPVAGPADAERAGRAARRLRCHRRDRGAARPGARGAVPGAGLRRDPPPARRVARRPPARGEPDARPSRGGGLHARPAAAPRGHAHALPPGTAPLLRPTRPADRRRRPRLGPGSDHDPGLAAAPQLRVLQADGGNRVRRPLRRRRRARPPRRGRRPRRRLAHLEDPALDLPRLPRPQSRQRPGRQGDRASARVVRGRPGQDRRTHDRPGPARRDPPRTGAGDGRARPQQAVRRARRGLRGARGGKEAASPAPLPRHRHLRAVDRGDGPPHPPRRRGASRRGYGAGSAVTAKPRIPLWRWGLWWVALLVGDFVFYVLLTPIWIGLRALAWAAEFRSRHG